MNSFTVIDFETANRNRASICQAAAVVVENGEVSSFKEWYIRPKDPVFDQMNTYVHGITFSDVKNAPEFPIVWEELKDIIQGKIVVAHNASFDIYALCDVLTEYGIELPLFSFYCTMASCKRTMPNEKYSLFNICNKLGITFENHHDAKYDALACASVVLKLGIDTNYCRNFPTDLIGHQTTSHSASNFFKPLRKADCSGIEIFDLSSVITSKTLINKSIVVTGEFTQISRHAVEEYVIKIGARLASSISKNTFLVIMGTTPGPSKIDKIKELNKTIFIPVIDEVEFLESLEVLGFVDN